MNVSLTDDLEAFIASKVASGGYRSASEVVREAVRLLREQDNHGWSLQELREAYDAGDDDDPVVYDRRIALGGN